MDQRSKKGQIEATSTNNVDVFALQHAKIFQSDVFVRATPVALEWYLSQSRRWVFL